MSSPPAVAEDQNSRDHETPPSAWTTSDVVHLMSEEEASSGDHGDTNTMSTMATSTGVAEPLVARPASMEKMRRHQGRKSSMIPLYRQPSAEVEQATQRVLGRMKAIYRTKVLPIEQVYSLHSFCLPTKHELLDAEFDARPMVLLLGPYSTGKSTFIRYLLGCDFPGLHIGPEPTTDKFLALIHGDGDDDVDEFALDEGDDDDNLKGKIIKGNTLTVMPELPFASLSSFGSAFLNHFNGSVFSAPLLKHVTIIDTPGVLSGEKQRLSRDYNFAQAAKWFADRSDLILLLFDAHKLDMSDELKEVVETIRPHNDDKIRCILNKCDGVERDQLVRVYGSLMWSMGKLFHSPEVARVYTGSFWDEPLLHDDFKKMFDQDEKFLMQELVSLPSTGAERKVNALVKRIRLVKVHLCILGYLSERMPRLFGMARVRKQLMENLDQVFDQVCLRYRLSRGDMPNVDEFRKALEPFPDFSVFEVPDSATLQQLDDLIASDIPTIMKGSGILGKAEKSQSKKHGISGGTKGKLRFLYELGFSMPPEDEQVERKPMSILWMFSTVTVVFVAIACGLYWYGKPLSMAELLKMPQIKMPEIQMPEMRVSSFVYIGGALAFLMLHFLLRTRGV